MRSGSAGAQRGVALLALLVLLVLGVAWYAVSGLNATTQRTAANRTDNAKVLAQAKAALIAYAAHQSILPSEEDPGRLPCPEAYGDMGTSNEGRAAPNCAPTAVGRLPWRTLGLPRLLDASGEPLWYVVSPGWALPSSTATLQINSNTQGLLNVDGQPNAAVALVVAPGGPLATAATTACPAFAQNRYVTPPASAKPSAPPFFCNYVESLTDRSASAPLAVSTGTSSRFNDQVLRVTDTDVLPGIEAAIAKRIERDIVPELLSAASSMPGSAGSLRFYPFAAAWSNPEIIYRNVSAGGTAGTGTAGISQGLLPLVRSRKACMLADPGCDATLLTMACDPATDAQCDPSRDIFWKIGSSNPPPFAVEVVPDHAWTVTWSDGSLARIALSPAYTGSGGIGGVDCSESSAQAIKCEISYGRKPPCGGPCNSVRPRIVVAAQTTATTGLAFRRVNSGILDGMFQPNAAANSIALHPDGSATVTTEWRLPSSGSPCPNTKCKKVEILIPRRYLEDNIALQSRLRDAPAPPQQDVRWFVRNAWHEVAYFALAPGLAPGGPGTCSDVAPVTCLQVANLSPADKQRAVLLLSGRSLNGSARPSMNLSNYLDPQINCKGNPPPAHCNRAGNRAFEQRTVNSSFNDRLVVIDSNP